MRQPCGIIAAGHEITANAATVVLQEGGNAFDASLAALLASCVAEPVLASLGGGGFLLAHRPETGPVLYDFFAQTPQHKPGIEDIGFYPILADFGHAQQEFHIGLGSIATPGMVRGLFRIHRDLCRLPLGIIAEPALIAAREGIRLNTFQHYIANIVAPILRATPAALKLHATAERPEQLAAPADLVRQRQMADSFETLVREGEHLFYSGEMTQPLIADCRTGGGYLRRQDLEQYRVILRTPQQLAYRRSRLITNPAPALGGVLIAFTLSLMQDVPLGNFEFGSENHLRFLARAMRLTQQLRREETLDANLEEASVRQIFARPFISRFKRLLNQPGQCSRGTTQISIADAEGNLASMTLSNGEGSGYVLPGTGIMMNNMLGEEDINPGGFHFWPENQRIASMMAPSLLFTEDGRTVATGSGGSNRIRSAILQVITNFIDFNMGLTEAVSRPRIHFESGLLSLEPERDAALLNALSDEFPKQKLWDGHNLFFGGAHSVMRATDHGLSGMGDPRRGGVCRIARGDAPDQSRN